MNQYMDPENYGPGVTFDLSKAIDDYLKTLDKTRIDLVVDFLNRDIEHPDPLATGRRRIDMPFLAEFKTNDAKNYIKNIFDAATGLGIPKTDPKYGNTGYVKDLVGQVLVNLEVLDIVPTDILNEADPLKSI